MWIHEIEFYWNEMTKTRGRENKFFKPDHSSAFFNLKLMESYEVLGKQIAREFLNTNSGKQM